MTSIEAFCQRVQAGLHGATFEQKRRLIELLSDRVVVTDGEVEIRYVIPMHPCSEHVRFCQLRKDYYNNVVAILGFTDGDGGAVLLIIALDGRFMGCTPVDGDLLLHAVAADRLGEEPLRSVRIALCCQQEINGLAGLIHGTIEVIPLAFDLDIRLIHAPADPHRTLTPVKRLFQQGTVFHDLALDGGVVDRYPALLQEFFDMPVAQGIRHLPAHAHKDDIGWEMGPFETDRHRRAPPCMHGWSIVSGTILAKEVSGDRDIR